MTTTTTITEKRLLWVYNLHTLTYFPTYHLHRGLRLGWGGTTVGVQGRHAYFVQHINYITDTTAFVGTFSSISGEGEDQGG